MPSVSGRLRSGAVCALAWLLAAAASPPDLAARLHAAAGRFSGQIVVADMHDMLLDARFGSAPHVAEWPWGSVSKQVTAVLVIEEVAAGRLHLADTIGDRLPDWPQDTTADSTIAQLLRHTAGLPNPNDTPDGGAGPAFYRRSGASVGGRQDAYGYCAGPRKHQAGPIFEYNNCDTIVLGAILERLTGTPFADLLARRIAQPLAMSTLHMAAPDEMPVAGQAKGRPVPRENLATYGPAGAMIGSAADLVAFDRALLAHSLLSTDWTTTMWRGDPMFGGVALGAWSFGASLAGCREGVRLVERRGIVGGVQSRNIIAPDFGIILIAFTDDADYDFGEISAGKGASYRLLSAILCAGQ